jgi:hypothetical protein
MPKAIGALPQPRVHHNAWDWGPRVADASVVAGNTTPRNMVGEKAAMVLESVTGSVCPACARRARPFRRVGLRRLLQQARIYHEEHEESQRFTEQIEQFPRNSASGAVRGGSQSDKRQGTGPGTHFRRRSRDLGYQLNRA